MKKVLCKIYIVVVLILILINIFSIFHVSFFGFRMYRIGSGSMKPYLNINDYILVRESDEYKVNDVITYQINGEYVTHRIVSISDDLIITKGDANNTSDEPIKNENIIGKIVMKFSVLGFILYLFSKPISLVLLLIISFLITTLMPNKKEEK